MNTNEPEISDLMMVMLALGDNNPGAYSVVSIIINEIDINSSKKEIIMEFIKELLNRHIVGTRLWYIYKNEAKLNINNLFELNFEKFDDEYFYEKFEKYMKNV